MKHVLLLLAPVFLSAGCIQLPMEPAGTMSPPVARAEPTAPPPPRPTTPAPVAMPVLTDRDIRAVYMDVLGREPGRSEIWDWRSRETPVSADGIAAALRDTREFLTLSPEHLIRRAFAEFHHTDPDETAMRYYRRKMIDEHWSAGRVRQSIAEQRVEERRSLREAPRRDETERPPHRPDREREDVPSPEAIVRRAYDDLLERAPDQAGLERYARMLRQGATEAEIRARIKQSEEYRVAVPDAKTRRAYRDVLGRDPDEDGLQHYRKLLVDRGWSEDDVKNDLRKSAEYRNRKR